MPANNKAQDKGLRGTEAQAKTRLILALWDIKGAEAEVKRKELTDRVLLNKERVGDYKSVFEQLKKEGAITIATKNRVEHVFLTDTGLHMLDAGIKSPDFEFEGKQVRTKDVVALLKWFRERETLSEGALVSAIPGKTAEAAIASYEEFKPEILSLFEKLDKGYNYSGLVPIWHLRRELGERVSRDEFTNWMMQIQSEQLFYLQSGEARGATDEQKRDSITDDVRGLLFFASQPSSEQ